MNIAARDNTEKSHRAAKHPLCKVEQCKPNMLYNPIPISKTNFHVSQDLAPVSREETGTGEVWECSGILAKISSQSDEVTQMCF